MTPVTLTGVVTGNVDTLQNASIAIVVEDPSKLFAETGYLTLVRTTTGYTYEVVLPGRPLTAAGHLTGNLRIFACLDTACKQPLGGTPLVVPYEVTVEDGLTLSRQDISVTVPFGTVPPIETVDVNWSSTNIGWIPANSTPYNPYAQTYVSFLQQGGVRHKEHALQIRIKPAPPGTYTETVSVRSIALFSDGSSHDFDKTITVHYTVTPNPSVDYVVWPAPTIELTQSASDPYVRDYNYQVITNTGVSASFLGVDYLSGAGTTGPATSWWDEYPFNGSYHSCVGSSCLVPGVYTAQVRYRLTTPSGATRDIAVPMRLTVGP
jgi:hypothetical protein